MSRRMFSPLHVVLVAVIWIYVSMAYLPSDDMEYLLTKHNDRREKKFALGLNDTLQSLGEYEAAKCIWNPEAAYTSDGNALTNVQFGSPASTSNPARVAMSYWSWKYRYLCGGQNITEALAPYAICQATDTIDDEGMKWMGCGMSLCPELVIEPFHVTVHDHNLIICLYMP